MTFAICHVKFNTAKKEIKSRDLGDANPVEVKASNLSLALAADVGLLIDISCECVGIVPFLSRTKTGDDGRGKDEAHSI